jgi:hypothetical protein
VAAGSSIWHLISLAPGRRTGQRCCRRTDVISTIGRVHVVLGTSALGPNDGGAVDVVAMDDFLYTEPRAVPGPGGLALLVMGGTILGAAARIWRRGRLV